MVPYDLLLEFATPSYVEITAEFVPDSYFDADSVGFGLPRQCSPLHSVSGLEVVTDVSKVFVVSTFNVFSDKVV